MSLWPCSRLQEGEGTKIYATLSEQICMMGRRAPGRLPSTSLRRGPSSKHRIEDGATRFYTCRRFGRSLVAASRGVIAPLLIALAAGITYEALFLPGPGPGRRLRCKSLRLEFPPNYTHEDIARRARVFRVASAITAHPYSWGSFVRRQSYRSRGMSSRHDSSSVAVTQSTLRGCNKRHKQGKNGSEDTSSSSASGIGCSNDECRSIENITREHSTNTVIWYRVIPAVINASAMRPTYTREKEIREEQEEDRSTENDSTTKVHHAETLARRTRKSRSLVRTRKKRRMSPTKAVMTNPVTFASLAAAVFVAGLLAGAGVMAVRAANQRDREKAAFVKRLAERMGDWAVEPDTSWYDAYMREMWSAARIVAGTAITSALQLLFNIFRLSPLLFVIADAGLKAGMLSWAGGSGIFTVLQHALLAGGYVSSVSMLGQWQLVILPLAVLLIYAAAGRGLKTKDSAASGAVFSENLPIMKARLKAEKDPKKRAVLAERLMESIARECKHKKLLDEGLVVALSQTLAQLKKDLLRGEDPEHSCARAQGKFNSMLSLKIVPRTEQKPPEPPASPGVRREPAQKTT